MPIRKKSNVFITGAGGFIGANIVRLILKKNFTVHVIKRDKNLSWRLKDISQSLIVHKGDLTDYKFIKKTLQAIQPDYIIHLAAYGAYHYQNELDKIIAINIDGTKNLLEASKDISYKCFINTGSSSEYGFKNTPMKESDYCDPVSYYAATKLAQTQLCKVFAKLNNKPIITLRPFSVYGPLEQPGRFIPTIMKAVIKNETIKLTPGNQRRDFIYVDDIANAYLKAFKIKREQYGEVYNIGTGHEYSNDEIVKQLFAVVNKKIPVEKGAYPKRSWDTDHWIADISKMRKNFNWKPEYTLNKGLISTYQWFEKNLSYYQ